MAKNGVNLSRLIEKIHTHATTTLKTEITTRCLFVEFFKSNAIYLCRLAVFLFLRLLLFILKQAGTDSYFHGQLVMHVNSTAKQSSCFLKILIGFTKRKALAWDSRAKPASLTPRTCETVSLSFFTLVPDRSFDCSHTSHVFNLRKNTGFFNLRACEEIQVWLN